jgi:hypothetical protein
MGSPTTFWQDKRAIRPLHRHRTESPCATNGVHVVQDSAQTLLALANDGVTGVTDWLR